MISSPYPGLRPFTQEETGIFFGRDSQIDQLLDKLGHAYFIAVVGVSGCGKSSLVTAGLLPALKAGFLAEAGIKWRVAAMHPGDRPMQNLASALLERSALGEERAELSHVEAFAFLLTTLRRGSLGLIEALDETPLPEKTNLLILVDQFEEIFQQSVKSDMNEAIAFVSLLLASAEQHSQIFVVITMRSDFLGDCPMFFGLPEAINDSQFLTPRLTRDQCRAAIQYPAAVFGSTLEPRLVNHLLNEMGDDPDQLPVLQHCLMRMWQYALERNQQNEEDLCPTDPTKTIQGIEIVWQDYKMVGGLRDAISQHGDEAIEEAKQSGEQAERITEYLFRALVEVVSNRRDMRRVAVGIEQIASEIDFPKAQIKGIAEIFCAPQYRFIQIHQGKEVTSDSKLSISHESLIRQWNKLKEWVNDETASSETYKHLEKTACLWKKGEAALWGSPDLEVALKWREQEHPTPAWVERYGKHFDLAKEFLDVSVSAYTQEEKRRQEERERQKNLEIAQKIAAEQTKAAKRFRWLAIGLACMFLIAVGGVWFANAQRTIAETARQEAEIQKTKVEKALVTVTEQKEFANAARQEAENQKKYAESNSLLFQEMVNSTFGFLAKSAQGKKFLDWTEKTGTIDRLIPTLQMLIDLSESIPKESKSTWKSELPSMSEPQKLQLFYTLGIEAAERAKQ